MGTCNAGANLAVTLIMTNANAAVVPPLSLCPQCDGTGVRTIHGDAGDGTDPDATCEVECGYCDAAAGTRRVVALQAVGRGTRWGGIERRGDHECPCGCKPPEDVAERERAAGMARVQRLMSLSGVGRR